MFPYLLTAYLTFGPALLLGTYLSDDPADRPSVLDQIGVGAAVVLAWPLVLAMVAWVEWRERRGIR